MSLPSRIAVLVVAVAALPLLFGRLGHEGIGADEATTTAWSVEMLERGSWFVPTLDGEPDLRKPPLKMWLVAATIAAWGPDEAAVRFWDAAAGLGIVAIVFALAMRFAGPVAACATALTLVTIPRFLFYHGVRANVHDGLLWLFSSSAISLWVFGARTTRTAAVCGGLAGLAILAKGAAGLAIPAVLVVWEIVTGNARVLAGRRTWLATAVALVVAGAWYVPAAIAEPAEFWRWTGFEAGTRLLGDAAFSEPWRFVVQTAHAFGFALPFVAIGLVPLRRFGREGWILPVWVLVVVAGFSVASIKLPWYVIPAYVPLAVLVGIGVGVVADRLPFGRPTVRRVTAIGLTVACLVPAWLAAWETTGTVRWTHGELRRFTEWAAVALAAETPVLVVTPPDAPHVFAEFERLDAYALGRRPGTVRVEPPRACAELDGRAGFVLVPDRVVPSLPCLDAATGALAVRRVFHLHRSEVWVPRHVFAVGLPAPPFFAAAESVIDVVAGEGLAAGWARIVDARGREIEGERAGVVVSLPVRPETEVIVEGDWPTGRPECRPRIVREGTVIAALDASPAVAAFGPTGSGLHRLAIERPCPDVPVFIRRLRIREPEGPGSHGIRSIDRTWLRGHRTVGEEREDPAASSGYALVADGAGFLFFQPVELPAGDYAVGFELRAPGRVSETRAVTVDVALSDGGPRLARRDLAGIELSAPYGFTRVDLRFHLAEPATVEPRVEVTGASEVRLGSVHLRSLW